MRRSFRCRCSFLQSLFSSGASRTLHSRRRRVFTGAKHVFTSAEGASSLRAPSGANPLAVPIQYRFDSPPSSCRFDATVSLRQAQPERLTWALARLWQPPVVSSLPRRRFATPTGKVEDAAVIPVSRKFFSRDISPEFRLRTVRPFSTPSCERRLRRRKAR